MNDSTVADMHRYRSLHERYDKLQIEVDGLKAGGPGGTLPPMDIIDAKIEASEARTDTKFAELRSDLQRFATKSTVWGAAGTVLGILLAVAAFAGDRFDAGLSQAEIVRAIEQSQQARDRAQDQKLDRILERVSPSPKASR